MVPVPPELSLLLPVPLLAAGAWLAVELGVVPTLQPLGSMTNQVRTTVFRFASAEDNVAFFRKYYGPTLKMFEALPASGREAPTGPQRA